MKGTVVSIYLEDFVTYRKVYVKPHANLNVIVGPNGSGKSTIVCGIVLGLGGNKKVIARGSTLASFIRYGCKKATIKIELHDGLSGTITITRIIHSDNKTTWLIGERQVSLKEVEELVASFNIQVSNLCQFLPQDRVSDFARMNPQTLLENTESSVGSSELYPTHVKLKELSKAKIEKENKLGNLKTELASEVQQNERINISLESARQKKEMMKKIKQLKVKKAWTVVNFHRMKIAKKEDQKKELQRKYEDLKKSHEPFTQKVKLLKKKEERIFREHCAQKTAASTKYRALESNLSQAQLFEDKILRLQQSLEKVKEAELTRQKEISFQENETQKMESELNEAMRRPDSVIKEELRILQAEMDSVNNEFGKLKLDEQELETQSTNIGYEIRAKDSELKRLKDRKDAQLRYLQQRKPDVYKALLWIQQNQHRFSGKIYGPILMELNIEPQHAKYLESTVSYQDLLGFICEEKADMNEAMVELRNRMNLKINFMHSGREHPPLSHYKPDIPIEKLRCFGFSMYLSELVSGPEPVMKYLYRSFKIHNIPIGNRRTDSHIENIPSNIRAYFSEKTRYTVSVSLYSKEKIIQMVQIGEPKLLKDIVDAESIRNVEAGKEALLQQERSLSEQMAKLRVSMSKLQATRDEVLHKKISVQKLIDSRTTLAAQIRLRRSRIEALRRSCVDVEEETRKCNESVKNVIREQCEHFTGTSNLYKDLMETNSKTMILKSNLDDVSRTLQSEQTKAVELMRQCEEAEKELKKAGKIVEELTNQNLLLYEDALQMSKGKAPTEEYLSGLTESLQDIDKEIQDLSVRADYIIDADEGEIAEYKARQVKIAGLQGKVDGLEAELSEVSTSLTAYKNEWLPPIRALVKKISENFGKCFKEMGCVGEVNLISGENEDDFDQYGIQIKVQFRRGDELRELSRYLQSGGERSVSTAIYLISLQELTYVPFRCVDEINQGMDPANERRVFSLLLNATNRTNTTQYFLLTPKLLDDLEYNRNVAIHVINNGLVNEKFTTWDTERYLNYDYVNSSDEDMEVDE